MLSTIIEAEILISGGLQRLPVCVATRLARPGDLAAFDFADVVVRYPVGVRDELVDGIGEGLPASE